jgi:DNA-binding NtrC family response regulator
MKILVVDDEAIVLRSCRAVLTAEGHAVLQAASVQEALQMIAAEQPALLLIDVKMPGLDGMHLMQRVAQEWPHLPVIVMSGYATGETIATARGLGAAAFIAKPFTPDELAAAVNAVTPTPKKEKNHG